MKTEAWTIPGKPEPTSILLMAVAAVAMALIWPLMGMPVIMLK